MTEHEAIKELKYDCEQLGKAIPCNTSWGQSINTAYGMAVAALEKQIPKKPKKIIKKYGKHKWKLKEDGTIDEYAWEFETHCGVICERCNETVCVFCVSDYEELEDCKEEYWLCPNCGKRNNCKRKHCECGQVFDWSEE